MQKLIGIKMNICIGGDLDGRDIDLNGPQLKASDIEEGKSSKYYKQKYILESDMYFFWIVYGIKFDEATERVEKNLRNK